MAQNEDDDFDDQVETVLADEVFEFPVPEQERAPRFRAKLAKEERKDVDSALPRRGREPCSTSEHG
jgi:hypothetical protein